MRNLHTSIKFMTKFTNKVIIRGKFTTLKAICLNFHKFHKINVSPDMDGQSQNPQSE